jgi:two-component system response regulator (stage 0 sporulation protein F)
MATILIIDDEASIRNLLKEVLERANHRVLEACDGQEGVEYLDAKVIAMTGAQGDKNFLDVAKLFGARRVFEKPFDLDKLVQAINEELAK